ncbi:acyl-CoA synthetase-like [Tropilaelaps mercedesae]|uniref:Acyl-CoA synthetase-like n=1 Tax=Tropilaelaps mercedesae TaxID=418985 RepID=A0A1V9XRB3_9ACAR|nr:acyl-CoA synthetase-like [Tropilaelaps mercedesae]
MKFGMAYCLDFVQHAQFLGLLLANAERVRSSDESRQSLDSPGKSPEKIAIVDINTGEEVTFRQLEQKVRSFAGALQKIGTNKSVTEMEYKFQTEDAEIEFILTDAANYDLEVYQLLNDPNCRVKKVVILSGTPTKSTREKLVFTVDQLPKSEFLEPSGVSVKKDLLAVSYTSGSTVQIGEAGELLWRGPQMTLGYWKRSSDDFTRDGFYSTGDMAIVDTSGQISIVGRKKFFIICLDERISPTEIEDVLLSHPAVREAIVVGTPHPVVKEAPTAMVVVSSTYTNSRDSLREELVSLVAKQLSDHKHLHGGVHFVESLNQTDSGKYARNIITQQALNIIKGVN